MKQSTSITSGLQYPEAEYTFEEDDDTPLKAVLFEAGWHFCSVICPTEAADETVEKELLRFIIATCGGFHIERITTKYLVDGTPNPQPSADFPGCEVRIYMMQHHSSECTT